MQFKQFDNMIRYKQFDQRISERRSSQLVGKWKSLAKLPACWVSSQLLLTVMPSNKLQNCLSIIYRLYSCSICCPTPSILRTQACSKASYLVFGCCRLSFWFLVWHVSINFACSFIRHCNTIQTCSGKIFYLHEKKIFLRQIKQHFYKSQKRFLSILLYILSLSFMN